jgi:hypothetical protein
MATVDKRTQRLHTRRLLKLADILTKFRPVKGKKFDMTTWGRHALDHNPEKEANFCGTAACALGHAAMDKGFRRAGLKMVWDTTNYDDNGFYYGEGMPQAYQANIYFNDAEGQNAGAAFFGLSYNEAYDVFLDFDCTKKEVIAKLKGYAKRREELLEGVEKEVYQDKLEEERWENEY